MIELLIGELMLRTYPVVNCRLGELSRVDESAAGFDKAISRLEDLAKQLPEGRRVIALRKAIECRQLVTDLKEIPEAVLPDATPVVDKCVQELTQEIDNVIASIQTPSSPPKESGIPPLAYVGGVAAAVGIAIFLLA